MAQVPNKARAVIIGGGVIGCSVAYHLAKLGWKDVVLLERKQLTSGTTWHAAGLIAQLRATANMTKLAKYSQELYGNLEAETGVSTGFKRCGSITVALTEERKEEIFRQAAMARAFGVDVEEISPAEVKAKYEHLNIEGVTGGVWLPLDGQGDPANISLALAKGARQMGAQVIERTKAMGVTRNGRRITSVQWENEQGDSGSIDCENVINCGGMWGHEVGRMLGVNVPLHACEHFYIVTEAIAGLTQMPVLRVPDECAYYKEDAGKMLLGAFEPVSKPWAMEGIPQDFEFDQLPEDFDHFEPYLESAVERMPMLAEVGIHTFFNGPESFTPDDAYHLGLAPEMDNVWVAAGFNSVGIIGWWRGASAWRNGWMQVKSRMIWAMSTSAACSHFRAINITYSNAPKKRWAFFMLITSPICKRKLPAGCAARLSITTLKKTEQYLANWRVGNALIGLPMSVKVLSYAYSWKRQNFFGNVASEHKAVRENLGLYDMSSFGKIRVEGPGACAFMNYIGGGQYDVPVGKIVYTQFLNDRAGIEADVTVTRMSETAYLVVTPAATRLADQTWMMRNKGAFNVVITDVTAGEAVLAVMGPNARKLLEMVSPNDFSNATNPFGTAQEIELGMGLARAHRVTYVGELGWEVYVSADMAGHAFETLWEAGQNLNAKLCGMHMMDSCRIEKGFRHFGHDITCEDHVLEAGLGFAVKTEKPNFIGRDAVMRKKETGLNTRMVQFKLTDSEPLLYHNEPVIRDGKIVGYLSSGNYGHHLGAAVGLGYVPCSGETALDLLASTYEIDVAGTRVAAEASLRSIYDPSGARAKV